MRDASTIDRPATVSQDTELPAATTVGRTAARPLLPLAVEDLVLELDGRRLIDGLDLVLDAGGPTIVMGPNGAGKSLLLRLLHGLLTSTAGSITWGGAPMSDAIRLRQAMVFQRPVLLRRSVAANIDFVLGLAGGKHDTTSATTRDALLAEVGLSEKAAQPARLLSGGEQQRLALARALATRPDILFLDEPTASLDPASTLLIEQLVLAAHARGTRIVMVTHDTGQARRLASEVVFVHRGRVVEHAEATRFFQAPASPQAADYLAGKLVF